MEDIIMVKLEQEHMDIVLDNRNMLLSFTEHYCCAKDVIENLLGILSSGIQNGLSARDMSTEICLIASEITNHPLSANADDVKTLIHRDISELSDEDAFMYISLLYDTVSDSYYGGAKNMTKSYLTFPQHSYVAWIHTISSRKRLEDTVSGLGWSGSDLRTETYRLLRQTDIDPIIADLVLCASDELKRDNLFAAYEKYTRIKESKEYYTAALHAVNLCALYCAAASKRIPYISPCITPEGLKLLYTTNKEPIELYSSSEFKYNLSKLEASPPDREYKKLCYKYFLKNVQPLKNPSDMDPNDLPFTNPLFAPAVQNYTADGPIALKGLWN